MRERKGEKEREIEKDMEIRIEERREHDTK
jgi:hypothetical protein